MRRMLVGLTLTLALGLAAAAQADLVGWENLFDGKTLEGWTQKNGTATYRVEDGAIVGRTAEGSPNSFLCTDKEYGDFELEFDVKVDAGLNSGVQLRSRTKTEQDLKPQKKKGADRNNVVGRVFGPQVEIASGQDDQSMSGHIYYEAMGGWLTPKEKLEAHKHFKGGDWNHFRILAKGPRIQVWINGAQIEDLNDEANYKAHPKGFLGLQVHGIGKDVAGPLQVAWKNIRIRELK